jgi:hypothetical protein
MPSAPGTVGPISPGPVESTATVHCVDELLRSVENANIGSIIVDSFLKDVPGFRLSPHQELKGSFANLAGLRFRQGSDGVQLSSDNAVSSLRLETSPDRCAVWNDESVADMGSIRLADLKTVGRIRILARDRIKAGHVEVRNLDIAAADSRNATERPSGFGVYVLQGAFTLWNLQDDPEIKITADIVGLSVGRADAPVLGSGIFVGGSGDEGGSVQVQLLATGPVYSDGRIKPGTPDLITGGVFVVHGATVDLVRNEGPVTTFGPNDMALDNWGAVDRWIASEKISTYGPSGIGFVNFGRTREIRITAPIETFGQGARGFNVYAGSVESAHFDRIVTHGDGAVGIQISQPVGRIFVANGIETFGGTGPSLVKGVVQELSAVGLSIKSGGRVRAVTIEGGLRTHGAVAPLEQAGSIGKLSIQDGFEQAPLELH